MGKEGDCKPGNKTPFPTIGSHNDYKNRIRNANQNSITSLQMHLQIHYPQPITTELPNHCRNDEKKKK